MSGILWRIIIAVICVVFVFALVPPIFRIFDLTLSADVWLVLRICVGAIALLYIIAGNRLFPPAS